MQLIRRLLCEPWTSFNCISSFFQPHRRMFPTLFAVPSRSITSGEEEKPRHVHRTPSRWKRKGLLDKFSDNRRRLYVYYKSLIHDMHRVYNVVV